MSAQILILVYVRLRLSASSSNTSLVLIFSRAHDVHLSLLHRPRDRIAIHDPPIRRIDVFVLLDAADCEICKEGKKQWT